MVPTKNAVRVKTVPLRLIGHLGFRGWFVVLTPAYHSIRGFRVNSWKFDLTMPPMSWQVGLLIGLKTTMCFRLLSDKKTADSANREQFFPGGTATPAKY
jgi:hypothetical protein